MRARLIANPQAGPDRAPAYLPLITAKIRTLVDDLEVTLSTSVEDTQRAAACAVEEGCDALYIAGGDGTLNAALQGLTAGGQRSEARGPETPIVQLPIGIIPLGTGNDFAKALGLGEEPEAALDALLECRVLDTDLGLVNDRPFVNTSAGGFIADVSESVTETLKNAAGKLAYLVAGARALIGTEPFSTSITIHDDRVHGAAPAEIGLRERLGGQVDVQLFAVCNARFIGGGYPIAPDALIDDGLLDVLIARKLPLLEFLAVLQRLATGQHRDDPAVTHFRAASFDLEFDRTIRVNTDDEVLQAARCHYRVRKRGASFFCGTSPQSIYEPRSWP